MNWGTADGVMFWLLTAAGVVIFLAGRYSERGRWQRTVDRKQAVIRELQREKRELIEQRFDELGVPRDDR